MKSKRQRATPWWRKPNILVPIVVATIGLAGVIGGALIENRASTPVSVVSAPPNPAATPTPIRSAKSSPLADASASRGPGVGTQGVPSDSARSAPLGMQGSLDSYIKFLEFRGNEIAEELDRAGEKDLREKFLDLHRQDMEALHNGNLILSHRINGRIRELLRSSKNAYLRLISRYQQAGERTDAVGTSGASNYALRLPYPSFSETYPDYRDKLEAVKKH